MTATGEKREVGFPWFERHAVKGNREIFQWTYSHDGTPSVSFPAPHINGAVWESREAMRDFYAAGDLYSSTALFADGVFRYAVNEWDGFSSWEEAVNWLMQKEDV